MPIVYTYIYGTGFSETLIGGAQPNYIYGYNGNDILDGAGGNDYIYGGGGNDTILGGGGSNFYHGGRGTDLVRYAGMIDDYDIVRPASLTGITNITRMTFAPEGKGADRLSNIESVYFAADNYTLNLNGRNNAVLARDDNGIAASTGVTSFTHSRLLSNDLEFDGDTLTILSASATTTRGAQLTLVDGHLDYNPGSIFMTLGAGQTATDTFTYQVDDGKGGSDTAMVTITVTGGDDSMTIFPDAGLIV